MGKKLVAYFSASGTTRKTAEMIAQAAEADLYEIVPKQPYSKSDLNWMDKKSRSSVEMSDKKFRPEITDTDANIDRYDEIILGFPIWWYVAPTIINTFLESYDFSGKTIMPFCSHGGGRFGQSLTAILKLAPKATLTEGLSIHYSGGASLSKGVEKWLKKCGVSHK